MKRYKTIGILGGMGPEATAELYLRIIRIFQQECQAKYDNDFPEIVILNLPLPDVVENPKEERVVERMLVAGVKKLETAGAEFVAIPCNTVTYFLSAMQEAVSIPILSILEETVKEVQKLGIGKVGIVGTEMTISKNIYGKVLENVKLITPSVAEQKAITGIIMNILAGNKCRDDQQRLEKITKDLKSQGAEKVILGCTELPLLIDGDDFLNTTKILAKAVVKKCMEE